MRLCVEAAAKHSAAALRNEFLSLLKSPMFSGIRRQTRMLDDIARAAWKKAHGRQTYPEPVPAMLPYIRNIQVFGDLTLTILTQ